MATVTQPPSMTMIWIHPSIFVAKSSAKGHTQTCAKAGFNDSRQYLPVACVTSATSVMKTLTKQYWKTPNQMICNMDQHRRHSSAASDVLTLNHVNPLLGVRHIPRSPPQHFLNQLSGNTQSLGRSDRK